IYFGADKKLSKETPAVEKFRRFLHRCGDETKLSASSAAIKIYKKATGGSDPPSSFGINKTGRAGKVSSFSCTI
ncbi:MAG: hypothetical protein IIB95_13880, partial [Candidatus Marinimicrobia bacterium]|nr:hypothetical protein [Candidatus Neomarinimicrobiota bacterium]